MDENNFMLVSLNDEKSKAIAEVLASPTCKKIINYLAEHKESSQKDLSEKIHAPMNTIDYNMKKLLNSGFIQKRKNFFWSAKGKKIIMYELSNKSVVISHKKSVSEKIKSIVPAFMLTAAGSFALWVYGKVSSLPRGAEKLASEALDSAESVVTAPAANYANVITSQPLWLWFLFGSLVAIFIISIINWRKL
ncbi:MAG: helix-turn-helix domain-containing protein [Candidatus Nanoarchaeia archaeon]|nr:helix-turn-helix domain-containing protein [Candidatus Nanoarchaeia archaeon]